MSTSTFQSPSLRGSGRFGREPFLDHIHISGFNPLHCGAVVASDLIAPRRMAEGQVSIPFIAGQWSLRDGTPSPPKGGGEFQSPSLRGSGRFVVTAAGKRSTPRFQSPSLRGSGRFALATRRRQAAVDGFNPLHCGAVVASSTSCRLSMSAPWFQSPSLRGSGRFKRPVPPGSQALFVSIPFIAGQWSLLERTLVGALARAMFQSPSLRGSGRFTKSSRWPATGTWNVSIPFIAGQWSLPGATGR